MRPVTGDVANTDAQRLNADADQDNWRLHGRTYDNQRFSPLTEINAANVKQLKPVAMIQTGVANAMEATPLEIDGVLFVESAGDVVQAYDAVTGEELWSYTPVLEFASMCCGPQARGVAVAYGKVYVAQVDGHVVALDAKTGKVIWKTAREDILPQPYHWYTFTGAPQVYNGLVVVGNGGAEWPTRGFVEALDAETGKLVWRFNDTAGPRRSQLQGRLGRRFLEDRRRLDVGCGGGGSQARPDDVRASAIPIPISMAISARATISTPPRSWRCMPRPARSPGTISRCRTMCGTGIRRRPPCCSMCRTRTARRCAAAAEANKNGFLYIVNRDNGKLIRRSDAFVKQSPSIVNMIPPDETARVYYPGNHGGAMWQPPAYSPLTHYFYTMGINEPHIYKVKASPSPGCRARRKWASNSAMPCPPMRSARRWSHR